MKRILITGAAGFIGSNLINRLIKDECKIAVINRISNNYNNSINEFVGDITDYDFVSKTIKNFNPTNVFHLAAYKKRSSIVEDIRTSIQVNLIGTLNLYESLLKLDSLKSVISIGTTDEYGDCLSPYNENFKESPLSAYGFSKFCVTKLSQFFYKNYNLPVNVLRPTIAYGPFQGMEMFIPSLITTMINGNFYNMTKGGQIRDFIYISDLLDVMILIDNREDIKGEVFNVGSGKSIKIRKVAELVAKELETNNLLKIGSINYRDNEIMNYKISTEKISKTLNWHTIMSLEKGLELTIKHYEKIKIR